MNQKKYVFFKTKNEGKNIYIVPVTDYESGIKLNRKSKDFKIGTFDDDFVDYLLNNDNVDEDDIFFFCPVDNMSYVKLKKECPDMDFISIINIMCGSYMDWVMTKKLEPVRLIYKKEFNAIVIITSDETEKTIKKAEIKISDAITRRLGTKSMPLEIDEALSEIFMNHDIKETDYDLSDGDPIIYMPIRTHLAINCTLGVSVYAYRKFREKCAELIEHPFTADEKESIRKCFKGESIILDEFFEAHECDRAVDAFMALVGFNENSTKEEFVEAAKRWNSYTVLK